MTLSILEYSEDDFIRRSYVYDLFGFLINQGSKVLKIINSEIDVNSFPQKNDQIIYAEIKAHLERENREQIEISSFAHYLISKYPDNFNLKDLGLFLATCQSKEASHVKDLNIAKDRAIFISRGHTKFLIYKNAVELVNAILNDKNDTSDNYVQKTAILADAIKNISDLQQSTHDLTVSAPETTKSMLEKMYRDEDPYIKIPTGFSALDEKLGGGLSLGTLNMIGARPSVGKTALASNLLSGIIFNEHKKDDPKPALFFTMEMTAEQILGRMYASMLGVNPNFLFKKDDPKNIINPVNLRNFNHVLMNVITDEKKRNYLDFCPKGSLTLNDIKSVIQTELNKYNGLSCIVLDYLQLMHVDPRQNRATAIGEITSYLKQLALDLNIPVICLAQLNRDMEKGKGGEIRPPRISDIKDSGSAEQDADLVLLIHKPQENAEKRQIIIAKNRNGQPDTLDCEFKGENFLFKGQGTDNDKLEFLIDNSWMYKYQTQGM